jgi:TatD DNase family protein
VCGGTLRAHGPLGCDESAENANAKLRDVIDTHCHLDAVPEPETSAAQLEALVAIGFNPERARSCLALARDFKNVFVTVGLHPTDAARFSPAVCADLEQLAASEHVVGIGESGVDYYWDSSTASVQLESLAWQLNWARRVDKPIVIHCRDRDNARAAFADCARALREAGWHKGILHCFAGDTELLETGLELGFHISYAGNLTYKNAQVIRDSAKLVPLERLLVETDAPYLAPVPHRGKPNRPEFVRHTLEALAEVRGLEVNEMERITSDNARAVYGLPARVHSSQP